MSDENRLISENDRLVYSSFSPKTLNLSISELENILTDLCEILPTVSTPHKATNEQGCETDARRLDTEIPRFRQWEKAHANITNLIKEKKSQAHNKKIFCIAILSLAVTTLSLLYTTTVIRGSLTNTQESIIELRDQVQSLEHKVKSPSPN